MVLQVLDTAFSVCRVKDASLIDFNAAYCFYGKTDEEFSLVCPENDVPDNVILRDDGWRGFRVAGTLDFALTGILSRIASVLADNAVPIFAVSTYNTDYVFTRATDFTRAIAALSNAGYIIQ